MSHYVIHIYVKFFHNPCINGKVMPGQTVLLHLILRCDLDLASNHTVLAHYTLSHDDERAKSKLNQIPATNEI